MRSSMGRGFSSDIRDDITVAIHQPCFLPYYGYFQKIFESDIFVFLDDTQFSNNNYQNYNYIVTPQGLSKLKVPVKKHFGDKICDTCINYETGWINKLKKTIEYNYKRAEHYSEASELVYSALDKTPRTLSELNIDIVTSIAQRMGITTEFKLASDSTKEGNGTEQLISITKALKAPKYLSGNGAKAYQEEEKFESENISLKYVELKNPLYKQQWGIQEANPSFLDYIMNEGFIIPKEWNTI